MLPLAKALLATLLLDLTLGLMFLGVVWAILSLMHAGMGVIISGEILAGLLVLVASWLLFRLILTNERQLPRS